MGSLRGRWLEEQHKAFESATGIPEGLNPLWEVSARQMAESARRFRAREGDQRVDHKYKIGDRLRLNSGPRAGTEGMVSDLTDVSGDYAAYIVAVAGKHEVWMEASADLILIDRKPAVADPSSASWMDKVKQYGGVVALVLVLAAGVYSHFKPGTNPSVDPPIVQPAVVLQFTEVAVPVGKIVEIGVKSSTSKVKWTLAEPGCDWRNCGNNLVFVANEVGVFHAHAWAVKKGEIADPVELKITAGDPKPIDPKPIDPKPKPIDPPKPVEPPAPINMPGLRVMMLYETSALGTYPKEQELVLFHKDVRDYLNSHCAKGSDGKTPERKIWDKDVDASNSDKWWQDTLAKHRAEKLPYLIISNGKTGYEGPMPDNKDRFLELAKKYEVQ